MSAKIKETGEAGVTGQGGSTVSLKQKLHADSDVPHGENGLLTPEEMPPELLREKLIEAEEKAMAAMDRSLRLQADMDNMQRRVERDIVNAHRFALEKFVVELLPVIDGFERALVAHAGEESGADSLLDGIGMTLRMLLSAFDKFGIKQVDPQGQPFNPEHHQAVSAQEDRKVKPGTVISVLQKGYLLNDRLVRPALVVVAKGE